MKEHDLLVELGTDELPFKILKKLGLDFFNYIKTELNKNSICFNTIQWFASPRHLAVTAKILIDEQNLYQKYKDYYNHYDCINGHSDISNTELNVSNSCLLFNHKKQLYKNDVFENNYIQNKNFKNLLLKVIHNTLERLVHYEMMRWGTLNISFIRPVNTIIILVDEYLIDGHFFGIDTDRISYGHRHIKNNKIIINHAKDYPDLLINKGYVLVDYYIRKKTIQIEVQKQATKLGGVVDMKDDKFLEEITSLIEWPVVLFGRFSKQFLSLPSEVIVHILKENQRYFPVYNVIDGILLPCFIFVINTITDNYKKIIIGHENTLRTRFMDAEFFLKNDNRYRLEDYIPKLSSILFHRKLGSLRKKTYRITELSGWIAHQINEDISQAKRAGYLCKCDLMTDMVLEFPKLQGIIGMYYARRDGELDKVAIAQKEYYKPYYIQDSLPIEKISCIVSIADKIDTISGIFGVKEIPTSSRDPFALKRAASGILNIIIQKKIPLKLVSLIHESVKLYGLCLTNSHIIVENIQKFMYKRLYACYCAQGYRSDIVISVLNINTNDIADCSMRICAINDFCTLKRKEYMQLHIIYKRISNILKGQDVSFFSNKTIQDSLLITLEEKKLFVQFNIVDKKIIHFCMEKRYDLALLEILNLFSCINDFLNNVIILDTNNNIQINRLLLIYRIKLLILKIIDVSILRV